MSLDRVDPECRPALEAFQQNTRGMNELPLPERRAMISALEAQVAAATPVPDQVETEDLTIPGPAGAPDIAVRVYRPVDRSGERPGIYFIHGGGMVVGNLESGHAQCLRLCSEFGAVVVNVDYRLAPEDPHPAPADDCYAGLAWMADHAQELGLDKDRIAIYGPSAGGGLALATALRARDLGTPTVAFVMAIYPMLDPRNVTPSSREITDLGIYDRADNERSWEWYLNGAEPDAYASPLLAEDLTGFPPTYIDVGTEDVFRDEDIAFAGQLLASGVPVELHVHPGAFHGSEILAPEAAVSRRQLARRAQAMRAALYPRPAIWAHQLAPAFASAVAQPDTLAEMLHPEATWSLPASLGVPIQVGREAIVQFRRDLYTDVFDGSTVELAVDDAVMDGETVAIRTRMTGDTRDGLRYDNDHTFFVSLRDGQIGNVQELLDPARAFAQITAAPGDGNEKGTIERISPTHLNIVTSIEIDAPHTVVWAVLTDFAALPEWSSGLQGLEGEFREGGDVTATFRMFGRDRKFAHVLTFFEEGAQFGWSDRATGLFTDRHVYRVEPLLNGRSRFIQSDQPQGGALRVMGGQVGRQTVTLYQAFNRELKARAEQLHRGEVSAD